MTALVLGSGAREHALGWAMARGGARLCFAPGNAGTAELGENLRGVDPCDPDAVLAAARLAQVDVVVVGPEEPLARGVADRVRGAGLPVFGPSQEAARLETSKAFSKAFMQRRGVPTPAAVPFTEYDAFRRHVESARERLVIVKSGLAAGKGVLVSDDVAAMLEFGKGVLSADTVLVEERIEGYELSVFALMDGSSYLLLPPCADHKRAGDGDTGPNTGGMGAVCPVPTVGARTWDRIRSEVVEPTMAGLRAEGLMYPGVLFLGVMVTSAGPNVLEYNVRFGDPETQVLLPAVDADWMGLISSCARGELDRVPAPSAGRACVGVVVASRGYPEGYRKGLPVRVSPEKAGDALLFHASTTRGEDGILRTGGGRCFTVVGSGAAIAEARERAYAAMGVVSFEGGWSRGDIGVKYLG